MSKNAKLISVICCVILFGIVTVSAQQYDSNTSKTLIQPSYLKAGDTVAIVAPSGILINREEEVNQAKALLESWELNVVIGKHVFKQNNHFAGTDDERCEDL